MKNKLILVISVCLVFILGVGFYFYFFGKKSEVVIGIPEKNNNIVGDAARYINSQTCDEYSQVAIEKLKIDRNKIHSCNSSKIENEDFYLVEIESGEAQDCPAGCFYELSMYKVSANKESVEEFNDGIEEEK